MRWHISSKETLGWFITVVVASFIILWLMGYSLAWACESFEECMEGNKLLWTNCIEGDLTNCRSEYSRPDILKAIAYKLDEISQQLRVPPILKEMQELDDQLTDKKRYGIPQGGFVDVTDYTLTNQQGESHEKIN